MIDDDFGELIYDGNESNWLKRSLEKNEAVFWQGRSARGWEVEVAVSVNYDSSFHCWLETKPSIKMERKQEEVFTFYYTAPRHSAARWTEFLFSKRLLATFSCYFSPIQSHCCPIQSGNQVNPRKLHPLSVHLIIWTCIIPQIHCLPVIICQLSYCHRYIC